jgi:tetratricopeptide (TPR) repeat protein
MDYVRNLRDRLPVIDRLSLLALVVMIVVGIADVLFVTRYIVPRLKERGNLQSQLTLAQEELDIARKAQAASPDELQEKIEAAQAKLDNLASIFFSDSQTSEVLNRLYRYALESEVEITDLQTQPAPTPPEEEAEEEGAYDVRQFRLQAKGLPYNLVDFVSRIEEAAVESFVISDVNITGDEEQSTLNMNVALYTSPYSPGATVPPTPSVTTTVIPEDIAQVEVMLAQAWASEDWEQVIGLIEQILALEPDYEGMTEKLYSAYVNYGDQLLQEGDPEGAKMQFENALEVNPEGEEAREGRDRAAAWVPMPGAAPTDTPVPPPVATSPVPPTPTLTVEEQLAQSLHESWAIASDDDKRAEEWEEVIGLIEQIRAINPNYDDMTEKLYAAHVNYGQQLVAEGRLEEAKLEFTRALEVKPDGGEAIAELQALAAGETPAPPATSTPTAEAQYTIHVVQPGEWLYQIARDYGTTAQAIMVANGLTSSTIRPGQRLRIPLQ